MGVGWVEWVKGVKGHAHTPSYESIALGVVYRMGARVHTILDICKLLIEGRGHVLESSVTLLIFAIFHSLSRSRHPDQLA